MGELDNTYGAVLIGAFISAVLFGITNLQTFIYFRQYPSDRIWNKISVCWLWMLDAAHLALCIHMVYWYLVTNYTNPPALLGVVWSLKAQVMVDAIVIASVQTLYTARLWKLNAVGNNKSAFSKFLPIAVSAIVVFGGYASCYEIDFYEAQARFAALSLYPSDTNISQWVSYLPLGAATVIDVVIALSLCYLLERCRIASTSSIDSTITMLMVYTLNTGVITSVCSLIAVITMAALPTTFAVISVEFILTKHVLDFHRFTPVYVNSFLAMFNARNKLRGLGSIVDADAIIQPLSTSYGARLSRDRKAPAFSFSPTSSTGRSDLRVSINLEHAPAIDVNVEHGHSIHFAFPGAGSVGSYESETKIREDERVDILPRKPILAAARVSAKQRGVPFPLEDPGADSHTHFGRTRVPRKSAYDAFAASRRDSTLLGDENIEEAWDGTQSTMRAQTPSELVGVALTTDA
ncbi:hypothetical protein DAEQUDRAFT_738629 [Daedalea quercina L-15889]|uniref:DUF6534 domain-containing protein n=1 Tax=Daedalea quercina L-15889 TaxID=1314783 RepID=A0A165PSC3_9APHY|nr:hypothetical protein DAEQUDRAFT_738629 [Daedalea quercina L-15889]